MFYIVVYLTLVTNKAAQSLKHTGKCTTKISLLAENTISCVYMHHSIVNIEDLF